MSNLYLPFSGHNIVDSLLGEYLKKAKCSVEVYIPGKSEEGRPIHMIVTGEGPDCILSFAGVHGNEKLPIIGISETLEKLWPGKMNDVLGKVSYVAVPVLNPDGEAMETRRNAKGININRDFGKYGPFKLRGSEFRSSEARTARKIFEYCMENFGHVLVIDHHQDSRFDPEFHTKEFGEPEEMVDEIGFFMRDSVRKLDIFRHGDLSVFDYRFQDNKGMLVNYTSEFCPSILTETSFFREAQITADMSALETFSRILNRTSSRELQETSRPEDRFSPNSTLQT